MSVAKKSSPKVLLIGFGNVGHKLLEIFSKEKNKFPNLSFFDPRIVGIFTKSHGALVNKSGLDLKTALRNFSRRNKFSSNHQDFSKLSSIEAVKKFNYDTLIELSTLSIKEKGEPSVTFVREALKRGKNVVTANKGPAAFAFKELTELAAKNNCKFLYESAVMDGAPVFNLFRNDLKGCKITEVSGILNSTTNFILSKMEEGETLENSINEAQRLGFAEANPDYDIEGWDAAAKITILANNLMGAAITPLDVEREGIRDITFTQIQNAIERGYRLKLVCRAWYKDKKLQTMVSIEEVPSDHLFSTVNGSGSILRVETDLIHPLTIAQEKSDLYDTAYGVINDLLTTIS